MLLFYIDVEQVGFGKGTASKQLWVDGIDPNITEPQLERNLSKYGNVSVHIIWRSSLLVLDIIIKCFVAYVYMIYFFPFWVGEEEVWET